MERIYESRPKNPSNVDNIEKFSGRKPMSIKARINQIYKLINKYGISSRKYTGDNWKAVDHYRKVIESLGYEFSYWCENGGYTDYDKTLEMNMSKEYKVRIESEDGKDISGYMKMMAAGTMEDPWSSYDTCMVLWPSNGRGLEESIRRAVRESIINLIG